MELTKEQIQQINNYLKEAGIKYWDIRIEMIDHFASKVENNTIELNEESLKKEFGHGYISSNKIQTRLKAINEKYRNLFLQEIISFFKSFRGLFIALGLFIVEYLLFHFLDIKIFKKVNMVLFLSVAAFAVLYSLKLLLKDRYSVHLNQAIFYVMISFLIFNLPFQLLNDGGIFKTEPTTYAFVLAIIVPLNLIFTYCGYVVFYRTQKYYNSIYNKLEKVCN